MDPSASTNRARVELGGLFIAEMAQLSLCRRSFALSAWRHQGGVIAPATQEVLTRQRPAGRERIQPSTLLATGEQEPAIRELRAGKQPRLSLGELLLDRPYFPLAISFIPECSHAPHAPVAPLIREWPTPLETHQPGVHNVRQL
jgi:hypothetical protein